MSEQLIPYKGKMPTVHESVYISPGVYIIGNVTLEAGSSVWFGSVLRGDDVKIIVGEGSNIQDGTVIHGDEGEVRIGKNVTVGHKAMLHGCTIADNALVGMCATVLDGAVVEEGAMVAAGAVVSPGKVVTAGTLWAGCPARELKSIDTPEMKAMFAESARIYQQHAQEYKSETTG